MEAANEIVKNVVQILMVPVKRHIDYLISCTKYVRDMGIKMTELNTAKVGVEEHMLQNTRSNLEVPAQVNDWLEYVEKLNGKVKKIPSDVKSCFNLKIRYKAGRNAFMIIEEIDSVMRRYYNINWTDRPIRLGRVDTVKASTYIPSTNNNEFHSREVIFTKALEALGPNQNSHMVALCGMGGVGKTTMMKKVKEVAKERKMFNFIAEAVIGEKTDPVAIQGEVASYLGIDLKEPSKSARAERLREWFKKNSDGGKIKFLIILDDVWQSVDMEDIGLSPRPNQGVDFKVLLTSRDKEVCTMMGVDVNSILNVAILSEAEAQSLFWKFVETSDPELHRIGEDIVRKCCGLPIAIKTMAYTLRGKSTDSWKDALSRLVHHNIHTIAPKVFETSYDNLKDEEIKSIFMLCGLFPEDFDIPTEELMRYGWGLKLFGRVYTIREARNRLNTCIERLRETNLLNESDEYGCVKMHDLVRAFILNMFSEVENASIVNHGSMSGTWPEENDMINSSCIRISLTCNGMSRIPQNLNNFPSLSILKLMHGDKSMRFPQDFYGEMRKLRVISYDQMKYPLLPSSPQCSTNLRVLHLHECSLRMFDCSLIGNHLNLEVLSFANSYIDCLPTTIGNLKKLRLLDLTNCGELYLGAGEDGRPVSLTYENYNEIVEHLENLNALEFKFFGNDVQLKKMLFENLQQFKISIGGYFNGNFGRSKNTLQLVINKGKVLESGINELFKRTEVLYLTVGDMNDLEDVEVKSPHQSSSFQNLRVLVVSECVELKYLFTLGVANTLSNLEHLQVYECDNMEELVHTGGNEEETITFPKLKTLSLCGLPKLSNLCNNFKIFELPQLVELELDNIPGFTSIYPKNKLRSYSLLKEEILIPKLEKLHIEGMGNLKEIWPCGFRESEEVKVSMLRRIAVVDCNNLVNLFPCNFMSLIHNLEELEVRNCGSVEVLFNIDLDSVGEVGEGGSLRSIKVERLGKLRELWRIKGADEPRLLIRSFQDVESIEIVGCKRFRNVFTPITSNFDLGALVEISIHNSMEVRRNDELVKSIQKEDDELVESSQRGKINMEEEISQILDGISNNVFPSCLMHSFHNLRKINLWNDKGVEVVFDMESPRSGELVTPHGNQHQILPNLKDLDIVGMESMSHVWKCNWNKYLILQKHSLESSFHDLTTIQMIHCKSIKYLFSPLMAKLLSNLKKIRMEWCGGIEEVVSNRDDEDEENTLSTSTHTSCTTLFPRLDSLTLSQLPNVKCIGGGSGGCANGGNSLLSTDSSTITPFVDQFEFSEAGVVSWSLCQYAREIDIQFCDAMSSVIPCYAAGQMQKLQVLRVSICHGMKEVFGTQGMTDRDEVNDGGIQQEIPSLNILLKLPNLKILEIEVCGLLEYVFPSSALESLRQLEELKIGNCKGMKVIVKEEDGEASSSKEEVVVFHRLKSIVLDGLPKLVGFFLGMNEFWWPSLDYVRIKKCPKMRVFSPGGSTAPQLKYMHTALGKHSLGEYGLNYHLHPPLDQTPIFPSLDSFATSEQGRPWSFRNLIEVDVESDLHVKKIIPSNGLLQLQKMEKIHVRSCYSVKEVFEAGGGNSSSSHESQTTTTTLVKLPDLREVELRWLNSLKYIWKSNEWTVFQFPNLTTLSISWCHTLQHVFSSSMVGSLLQLQDLSIRNCKHMEEVVITDSNDGVEEEEEEEESHAKTNHIITLPRLKSLDIYSLPSLKGFCLGKEDFSFPLFDTLLIDQCPAITIFTKGHSATPQLREIQINDGSFYAADVDINHFIKIKQEEFGRDLYDM